MKEMKEIKKYDVVIIGAATSGVYFARKMAKRGFSVKVIEKLSAEKTGTKYDIFHVTRTDINTFDIPAVREGDPEWAFEFTDNHFSSPSNKYSIPTVAETVGLHMQPYTALMARRAVEAGAEIEYCASFREFVFSDGVISGVRYDSENGPAEIGAKVVVDCSGPCAVGRRALPNGYGVERFALTDEDMFYVVLRYVRFPEAQINTFWLHAKSWYAPFSMNPTDKIIGTGSTGSIERAEKEARRLDETTLPEGGEVLRTEKGITPYRRPPYSLVADNFIVSGDAACLTKPDCGEGVTSSMVMMDIAAEVLAEALGNGDTSKEALWKINTEYNKKQGADFCLVRALLTKVVNAVKDEEIEYCFESNILNSKFLNGDKLTPADIVNAVKEVAKGVSKKNISAATIGAALKGAALGAELREHYMLFPQSPAKFDSWCRRSDKLWKKVGKVK